MRGVIRTRFRSIFVRVALLGLVLAVLAVVFRWELLTALARHLVLSEPPKAADLIFVLGGDFWGPRAIRGAELGRQGMAPKVMISGPPYFDRPESELSIQFLVERGFPRDLFISYPHFAKSTIEEVEAVCPELKRRKVKTVLLVTSDYHSRRANTAFQLFCPGIEFHSTVPKEEEFHTHEWWNRPTDQRLFYSEWEKLVGTVLWKYPEYTFTSLWRKMRGR